VVLTTVVGRGLPFHRTWEAATKLAPVTVRVKAPPPAVALLGARDESVGAAALMVKVSVEDVPPPGAGVNTVT
jgi:hypothetical protein